MAPKVVNYGFAIVGWMAHDALLFDRNCPTCHKMYSSFEHKTCPQCGGELGYITIPSGRKMSIMECTLYPNFNDATRRKNAEDTRARKGAVPITYRFKAFSFSDDEGVLAPPDEYHRMVKGALVSVRMYNHELLATPFEKRNGDTGVELMVQVYPQFGDIVSILKEGKAAEHQIDDPGTKDAAKSAPAAPASAPQAPVSASNESDTDKRLSRLEAMFAQVLELAKSNQAASAPPAAEAPVDPTPEDDFDCIEGVVVVEQ